MVVREVVPGIAVRAVVLADCAPLPLAEIGPPEAPALLAAVGGGKARTLGRQGLGRSSFGAVHHVGSSVHLASSSARNSISRHLPRFDHRQRPQQLAHRPGLERAAARRVRRLGVGDLAQMPDPGLVQMLEQGHDEPGFGLRTGLGRVAPPASRTSTNGPISQGQTVPWW